MDGWRELGLIAVLLLALVGCASLIRWLSLRLCRLPADITSFRVVMIPGEKAVEPLFRCLQGQCAWQHPRDGKTVLLLPSRCGKEEGVVERLKNECSGILTMNITELIVLMWILQNNQ